MSLTATQKSLKKWSSQKWKTKSGKPSTQGPLATGERYLPSKKIESLTDAEYAATTKKKREGTAKGKQFVKNTEAATVKAYKGVKIIPLKKKKKRKKR